MRTRFAPLPHIAADPARPAAGSRAGRCAAVAVLTGLVLALPAAPALAHAEIEPELGATSPAPSSTVAQVPREVAMTFTSPVAAESTATIVDGCGSIVSGTSSVDGGTVVVAVRGDAQPGTWSVQYRNLSLEDGHTGTGEYSFTVSGTPDCGAGAAAGGPAQEEAPDLAAAGAADPAGGAGAWAGLAGFAAAALAAAVAVLVVRRSAGARRA